VKNKNSNKGLFGSKEALFFSWEEVLFLTISSIAVVLMFFLDIEADILQGISLFFIIFLGIPHGAIDNKLFWNKKGKRDTIFVILYLLIAFFTTVVWLLAPVFSFFTFLLYSAYHFGQCQLSYITEKNNFFSNSLFLSWGGVMISFLIHFNLGDIYRVSNTYPEFSLITNAFNGFDSIYLVVVSSLIFLALFTYNNYRRRVKYISFLRELIILILSGYFFYTLPFLVDFMLFFCILHSLRSMKHQYSFLQKNEKQVTISKYFKYILPFTIISILGLLFIYILGKVVQLPYSFGYIFLVIISAITVPHLFVMNRFYEKA
jgi:Brp/Blh family beta-carotene 15,15'-monooxygenase